MEACKDSICHLIRYHTYLRCFEKGKKSGRENKRVSERILVYVREQPS